MMPDDPRMRNADDRAEPPLAKTDDAEIGLKRGIVRLADHQPGWDRLFAGEAAALHAALGERALHIEHVGSTAVSGLAAKPIIDIIVALRAMDDADDAARILADFGYEVIPEDPVPDRLFLVKGPPETRQIHLSLCELPSRCWRSHVLFRDHLRSNPTAAETYATLKRDLAARYPDDRAAYTSGKEAFIHQALAAAENRAGADAASEPRVGNDASSPTG